MEFVKPKPIYPELTEDEVIANRRLWIEDLETTDKTQCRRIMYDGTGFCCLGIAALRFAPKFLEKVDKSNDSNNKELYAAVRHYLDLPKHYGSDVQNKTINGKINRVFAQSLLVDYNDNLKYAFKEIALRSKEAWGL